MIVDEDGLVLTGFRAAGSDPTVLVEMVDGSKRTGIVLGVDSVAGLALVKVNGDGFSSLPLGDAASLEAGDALLTLGFPAQGGVGEIEWELSDPPFQWFTVGPRRDIAYINPDDYLAPGYVGGPTVAEDGSMVGLATATGLIATVDYVKGVLPSLREGADVSVSVRGDILYTWLETTLSESFLFATDEEGNGEEVIPRQKISGSYVERSPDGSRIVYASPRGLSANWDIYLANSDGSSEIRLTHSRGAELRPSWGPKGEKLVFTSDRDSIEDEVKTDEVYIMNADGTDEVRLTENEAQDRDPHISPDGSKIVFISNRDDNDEVYVMDINGGNASRLTNDEGTEGSPRWSPDGQKIVFDSDRAGNADVYVMNADGGSVRVLTSGPEGELMADWSPDGTKIVYAVALAIGPLELFVMNADGSEKRQITMGGGLKVYPRWGALPGDMPSVPSNTSIAFASDRSGDTDIYRMEPSGNHVARLTGSQARDESPAWSPDGGLIAFQSFRDGNGEIYVMDTDGLGQRNLTANAALDAHPSWSPDGARIAFDTDRDGNKDVYVMSSDGSEHTNLTDRPGEDYGRRGLPMAAP